MSFKLNNSQKDHLYWFFPLLFLGLAFIAISLDKNDKKEATQTITNVKSDSSKIISTKSMMADSLNTQAFYDGFPIPMAY